MSSFSLILYDFLLPISLPGPVVLIIPGLSPFKRVVRWKCINLDSRLQYKAVFEESPLVKPQRQGDSDENKGGWRSESKNITERFTALLGEPSVSQHTQIGGARPLRLQPHALSNEFYRTKLGWLRQPLALSCVYVRFGWLGSLGNLKGQRVVCAWLYRSKMMAWI